MRRLADRLTYRILVIAGTALFAGFGIALTYALPLATAHDDGWFAVHDGTMATGLMLGLFLTYAGVTVVRLLVPRKRKKRKRHERSRVRQAQPQGRGSSAETGLPTGLAGHGRWSATLSAEMPQPVQVPAHRQPGGRSPACPRKQ